VGCAIRRPVMGRIRRSFDIQFKLKVCEAIDSGQRTVLEMCREYQIQRPVVEGWLKKYTRGQLEPRSKTKDAEYEREIEKLRAKVGELTMQMDSLKKLHQKRSTKSDDGWRRSGGSSDLGGLRVKSPILLPAPTTTAKKDKKS
jgi:transposase-like protein